jgi:hypothetical protein
LLSGCIIQQPAARYPTAQEVASQIERDYASTTPAPAEPPAQTPAPAHYSNAEITISQSARDRALATIGNLSGDLKLDLVATTLDGEADYLKMHGYPDEGAEMTLLAAYLWDVEDTGSHQIMFTCTDENAEWLHVISKDTTAWGTLPWTEARRGTKTEQEMADWDAVDLVGSVIVTRMADHCKELNTPQTAHHHRHRHHQAAPSALPKGVHEL